MRIVIFDCNGYGSSIHRRHLGDVIGAGPRTVAGILESYGLEVRILEPEAYSSSFAKKADIVMFSGMITDFKVIRKLSRKFRSKLQIIGGPIANEWEFVLKKSYAKIAVVGEAEESLRELIESGFDPKGIQGVAYKLDDGSVIFNGPRGFLPQSKYHLITPSVRRIRDYRLHWTRKVYVEVLRGCSNCIPFMGKCGCAFCDVPNTFGYPKFRDPESILQEIEGLLKQGVRRIVLSGPDFLDYYRGEQLYDPRAPPEPNVQAIKSLLESIRRLTKRYNAYFRIENIKPNLMTEEVAEVLSEYIDPFLVGVGVESGSDKALRLMNKPYSIKEVLNALEIMERYNLGSFLYFIYGLPFENREMIESTKQLLLKIYRRFRSVDRFAFSKFLPLPNSAFYIFARTNLEPKYRVAREELLPLVNELNRRIKERRYVGRLMEYFVVSRISQDSFLGFPVKDGPYAVIKARRKNLRPGKRVRVKILGATSKHLLAKLA
jgi:radical SAM superfamily enzyme YgiQ (UPF0313 family)